ncbi:hypothetical protein [Bacillus gaemokensis]|uniref:Uncharacterized protein n=1 Tax=Bacillus gaemokensis TaxID=574375 RepID=A0A073KBB7_9BACI|nr:hypothetical protein [Bacillus gaemokensis]KEK23855.1 hypothetical protein BAGA_05265 [Bacillus gaemokensis]KYG38096.1 hypothetical protein AZF08_20305 [Bacillus gaemokensis]
MKKIIKSITNALAKAQEKNRGVATLRYDVVKRAIEREEFEKMICAYHYTDDYVWDSVNNFGQGEVSKESLLQKFGWLTPSCWVQVKDIEGKKYYEVSVSFHSNLAYDLFIPVA